MRRCFWGLCFHLLVTPSCTAIPCKLPKYTPYPSLWHLGARMLEYVVEASHNKNQGYTPYGMFFLFSSKVIRHVISSRLCCGSAQWPSSHRRRRGNGYLKLLVSLPHLFNGPSWVRLLWISQLPGHTNIQCFPGPLPWSCPKSLGQGLAVQESFE